MLIWQSNAARWTLECEQVGELTREQWAELIQLVYERDLYQAWRRSKDLALLRTSFEVWRRTNQNACVAAFLDPSVSGTCSGRLTFNHVHDRGKAALQKKAADDERHLVTLCERHHGFSWTSGGWANTAAAIELERTYLEALYP